MTCEDCPQHPDVQKAENQTSFPRHGNGPGWVVYTGGSHENHLAMMRFTLPPEYQRATFHSDGSIEYQDNEGSWEPPRLINGYQPDVSNPRIFHPMWEPCTLRMYSTTIHESCQCVDVVTACMRSEQLLVSYDDCKRCNHRTAIPTRAVKQINSSRP